jgi:hypothetical protein
VARPRWRNGRTRRAASRRADQCSDRKRLRLFTRFVSEASRPPEEIGWSNAWSWPRWFRYEGMKEASPFGTKLLCVLNRSGWASDLDAGFGGPGRSVGYGVLGVGRNGKSVKLRSENAGMDGPRGSRIKNCNRGSARVATACGSVRGSAVNRIQHFRLSGLPAENGA